MIVKLNIYNIYVYMKCKNCNDINVQTGQDKSRESVISALNIFELETATILNCIYDCIPSKGLAMSFKNILSSLSLYAQEIHNHQCKLHQLFVVTAILQRISQGPYLFIHGVGLLLYCCKFQ